MVMMSLDRFGLVNDGVEAVVLVGSVIDRANGAIGFHQCVTPFYDIAVTRFMLGLDVTRVEIVHAVFVTVFRMSLREKMRLFNVKCRKTEN